MHKHHELFIGAFPDRELLGTSFSKALFNSSRGPTQRPFDLHWQIYLLSLMLGIIFTVSVYDVYWSFKTAETLPQMEQNPIGTWLINADGGDISLFMTAKMAGTMLVILSVPALYSYRKYWGLVCGAALCCFQCLLLVYFEFGHLLMIR